MRIDRPHSCSASIIKSHRVSAATSAATSATTKFLIIVSINLVSCILFGSSYASDKGDKTPLIIKPKNPDTINISDLHSGEEELRSGIALETEKGLKKVSPSTDAQSGGLEDPDLLKITPIAVGTVVGINVSPDKKGAGESAEEAAGSTKTEPPKSAEATDPLGDFEFPEETNEEGKTEKTENPEEVDQESAQEVNQLSIEVTDEANKKEETPEEADVPKLVEGTEKTESSENKTQQEAVREDIPTPSETSEAETLEVELPSDPSIETALNPPVPPMAEADTEKEKEEGTNRQPEEVKEKIADQSPKTSKSSKESNDLPAPSTLSEEEIKEALKPEYKKIAADIQKEIDEIKKSGRTISKEERESFSKEFEKRKEEAKKKFLNSQDTKTQNTSSNPPKVEEEIDILESL